MNLVDELHAVAAALTAAGIRYAICGGIAVTIHGAIRSTKDIDVLIDPADVARVLDVVRLLGYTFAALPMTFDEGGAAERHVQRVSKVVGAQHMLIDLLLADGILATAMDDRIDVVLEAGPLSVVSLVTLKRMKQLAGRAQDLADLEKLEANDEP